MATQYQSTKWGVALTPAGTGATEADKAMAADGYSVFHKGYLERLSQSADIALVATNSITINDLTANGGNGILNLSTAGRSLSLTAGAGGITMLNTANTLRTNGGAISVSSGGLVSLGNLDTTGNGATASGADITVINGASSNIGAATFNTGTTGRLTLSGTYTTGGSNLSLTAGGGLLLGSYAVPTTINTGNGNLSFNNNLSLYSNTTLNVGSGTLTFGGTVNAYYSALTSVQALVVGGGGGGNGGVNNAFYGSGGAGGTVIYNAAASVTAGSTVAVTVGAGGLGATPTPGNGGSSVFGSIIATGGSGVINTSRTGGSNASFSGGTNSTSFFGGAGAGAGGNASGSTPGIGVTSSITGTAVTYGTGGAWRTRFDCFRVGKYG